MIALLENSTPPISEHVSSAPVMSSETTAATEIPKAANSSPMVQNKKIRKKAGLHGNGGGLHASKRQASFLHTLKAGRALHASLASEP